MRTLLIALASLVCQGHGQTWLAAPGSANWSDSENWDPATVPDGATNAFFETSTATTIEVDGQFSVDSAEFSADAFTFEIGEDRVLTFTGAGIVNSSLETQTFRVINGALFFLNAANADLSEIEVDSGSVFFDDDSMAGFATITTSNGGSVSFSNNATADDAFITNEATGVTAFNDLSSACCALIVNRAGSQTTFNGGSTAQYADIWNDGGVTIFTSSSDAGSAWIQSSSGGNTIFQDTARADSAVLLADPSGYVSFTDNASAESAAISTSGGAATFSGEATAADAVIDAADGSTVWFSGDSTAADAMIVIDGSSALYFSENASAGNAQIVSDGAIFFTDASEADSATIIANNLLDISGNTTGSMSIGSLSGSTVIVLGGNDLLLGSMEWDGGGAMFFELGLDPGLVDIAGAFERGEEGSFEFLFTLGDGAAPGLYTLIAFGSTTFSEEDFSFSGPQGLTGYFVMNGSSLGFQVTAVPEPAIVGAAFAAFAIAAVLRRRRAA